MEGKLRQLMKHEGINSTRLAEMLGIQASGISHIMSGRNKPSFDFLLKLLGRFPQINPDWLILDKGPMYRDEIKNKSGSATASGAKNVSGAGSSDNMGRLGAVGGVGSVGAASAASAAGVAGGMGWLGFTGGVANMMGAGIASGAGAGVGSYADASAGAGGIGVIGGGDSGASGELFGPDNADIIPSVGASGLPGGYSGGYSGGGGGYPGEPGGYSADHHAGHPDYPGHPAGQTGQRVLRQELQHIQHIARKYAQQQNPQHNLHQNAQQTSQQAPQQISRQEIQPPVYQSGGFAKSALIERIVVFYKDKTFSEYQPE